MKKSTKVVYLEKSQSAQGAVVKAGEYTEVVGTCRGILFQTLNEAIRELFVEIDDDLYKLAENSTSNARQTLFFDAMRSIRILQKQAEPAYLQMIEDAYQSFWNGDTILSARQAESQEEENLSLVEKDDLEEDLAVSTMINKTNDACHRELAALNARFAHMLGKGDLTVEANPVSPAMLALAFREILQEWDSEVLARIVVYKCFDRVVLSRMKACYEAMNHYLVEKGVLPEIRHGVPVSSRPAAERATHTSPAGGVQEPGGAAGEPEQEVPSLTQIWQFLQQHGALPETGLLRVDVNPGLPAMPRTGVMEALTRLQGDVHSDHELEQLDPALQQEFIRHQLAEMLLVRNEQGTPVQRVGETEQRVIDVILVLFNHILEDPALPDAMRALIGRLQIPVLKVAIQDPGFIHHENHPARRLVDDLARASMGWRDDDDRGDQSLYAQVKKAVERIVHEYREDVALFEEVRAEFAAYMENRERARKILEERLTQAVSGEERLTVAKLKVEELVRGLHPGVLPEAAREILEGPWKKLLTILWLREGEEGSNWKKAVEIAEMMGRYLGGAPRKFSRERLLSEIPEIISGLKKGFAYISLDQKKATNLLNGLQTCFINALRAEPFRPSVVGEEETVKPEASGEEAATDEAGSDAKAANEPDEFDEKVAAIGEGTWIRLSAGDGDGDVVTCKLVWRSKYTGTMVFVDGQGNKAAQLKEEELAEHFRSGSAEFLEDAQAPLIDRAIRKMMRVLNAEVVGLRLKMSD